MNRNISLVFSIFLLAGILVPAYAQTTDNVVINEVDINPPGNDAASVSEWVELYNPTDSDVDLGGWEIASTTVLKKTLTIPYGKIIEPGQFLTFSYQTAWFTDSNESVELVDETGIVIDKTPVISDLQNDFTSWQRIYDGYGLDSIDGWKFVTSTTGSSNGKLIEIQESQEVLVTVSSDKSSYLFGEIAVIEGSVSKVATPVKPEFKPELIMIEIIGPNFYNTVELYPDRDLNFETTLILNQVLGINEGTYVVSVNYAGATTNTSFSVGSELIEQEIIEDSLLSIVTDKSEYIPGQTVSITGFTTEAIPFESMKFIVKDSQGQLISGGNLFPTNGEFVTAIFITTVNPNYGTYEIIAEYFDTSALTTFEVVEDYKESVPVSLWTDKEVYGLGDTVTITGRLNINSNTESINLEILQTKNLALGTGEQAGGGSVLKILDGASLDGFGFFSYSFTIPISDSRLGDYLIKTGNEVGSAIKYIKVVENPETYVLITDPLVVRTDKSLYDFNLDKQVIISGQILNPVIRTSFEVPIVKVTISTEDGSPLEIIGLPEGFKRLSTGGISVGYEFTAIPESSGFFTVKIGLDRLIFSEGKYVIHAQYQKISSDTSFEIIDLLKIGDPTIYVTLDKSVYGLGETVKLTGTQSTDSQGITIIVHKPGGDSHVSGTTIEGGFFSWEWQTPVQEKTIVVERDYFTPTNFGIYRIHLETETQDTDVFFKVSPTPENDELVVPPLSVSTSKPLYKAGEKLLVEGQVNKKSLGAEGLVIPERVIIKIIDGAFPYKQMLESAVYPNDGGEFSSLFELPITVFSQGSYTVKAFYESSKTETTFSVANDFVFGIDEPVSLLVSIDKSEYYPGDTVIINGKLNKLVYFEIFDVSVIQETDTGFTCGSFYCGEHVGPVTSIRPSPSGSFTHQFVISDSVSSIGSYEVTVDADFDTKYIKFNVIEKPLTLKSNTVIEKENRIPEKTISIFTEEKTIDDITIAPRVLSGSLITPSRTDESNVNLKISTVTGTCIIGPDADCLVRESTRKPGQIYNVVEVDGISLNVRYSGPDVRLEKFSILPESSTAFLPDTNWNIEVIKDDQVSRFYYKVTYKTLE